jgi:pantoate--beta-alanine ligase
MTKNSSTTLSDPTDQLQVANTLDELRRVVADARLRGERIGCVPTMGALHAGHLSLIKTARNNCDFLVATVFVNPTQFSPHEDLDRYPRPFDADLAACARNGVDLVYAPVTEAMYPEDFSTFVDVEGLSTVLEGEHRPGHFRGVATVVVKLLNQVQPDVAFFGRKDYQQQLLIRKVCRELSLPVHIETCPTVREPDGLALSSRNAYLSEEQRKSALSLAAALRLGRDKLRSGETDVAAVRKAMHDYLSAHEGVTIDYVTVADPETLDELSEPLPKMIALVAARVGTTRLIDNLPIEL